MVGCAGNSPSCRQSLQPQWASTTALAKDIHQLTSPEFGGRKTASAGAQKTQRYLVERFQQIGLTPWRDHYRHPFNYRYQFNPKTGTNLIGTLPSTAGSQPNDSSRWRLLIAHYDHLGRQGHRYYPGADDNASGVAAMLHAAEYIHHVTDTQQRDNIHYMFVAIDAEEPGLFGSQALVKQLLKQIAPYQIELVLNLDMVGHPSRRFQLFAEGSKNFSHFLKFAPQLTAKNNLCLKLGHPRPLPTQVSRTNWLKASDHYSFHQAGLPWLYFGVPTHSDYHQFTDTLETLNLPFLAAVTEASVNFMLLPSELLTVSP